MSNINILFCILSLRTVLSMGQNVSRSNVNRNPYEKILKDRCPLTDNVKQTITVIVNKEIAYGRLSRNQKILPDYFIDVDHSFIVRRNYFDANSSVVMLNKLAKMNELAQISTIKEYADSVRPFAKVQCVYNKDFIEVFEEPLTNSLEQYVSHYNLDNKQYSVIWNLQITVALLRALKRFHEAGYLHLNIRPESIYLRNDYQPILGGYDVTTKIEFEDGEPQKREDMDKDFINFFDNNEFYMLVESLESELTNKTDIFALGVVIYQIWNRDFDDSIENGTDGLWDNLSPKDLHTRINTFCEGYDDKRELDIMDKIRKAVYCNSLSNIVKSMIKETPSERPELEQLIGSVINSSEDMILYYEDLIFEENLKEKMLNKHLINIGSQLEHLNPNNRSDEDRREGKDKRQPEEEPDNDEEFFSDIKLDKSNLLKTLSIQSYKPGPEDEIGLDSDNEELNKQKTYYSTLSSIDKRDLEFYSLNLDVFNQYRLTLIESLGKFLNELKAMKTENCKIRVRILEENNFLFDIITSKNRDLPQKLKDFIASKDKYLESTILACLESSKGIRHSNNGPMLLLI